MARPKSDVQRKSAGIRINPVLTRSIKILSAKLDRPMNLIVEEAILDVLKKYHERPLKG